MMMNKRLAVEVTGKIHSDFKSGSLKDFLLSCVLCNLSFFFVFTNAGPY